MSRHVASHAFAVLVLAAVAVTAAAETRPLQVGDYLNWEQVADPQLAPDGTQLVYTRRHVDTMKDQWAPELWMVRTDGTHNRFLGSGSNARWSPDGTRLAWLDDGDPDGEQIWVRWMDAEGAVTQITHTHDSPQNLTWSPDGTRIAYTALVPVKDTWKIEIPEKPENAEWTKAPRVVEHMHYRQDRRGFLESGFTHLFVVDAAGGTPRQLTEGDWNVGARTSGIVDDVVLSWTPDGRTIVFDGLRADDADRRYRESHLYAIDVASRDIRQITQRKGPWTAPVVSPDGRRIAFVGFDWTAQAYKADELWTIGFDGTDMRRISGDFDRDPFNLDWAADGRGIYFTAEDHGTSNVYFATASGGNVRPVTRGAHLLTLTSTAASGMAAGVLTEAQRPADIAVFRLAGGQKPARVTAVNDDVLGDRDLGRVEEVDYASKDGTRLQGWLVYPPDFDAARRYPLILHIHGGPHSMYNTGFNFSFQHFAANGYLVLYTNPRGSTGYGTTFGNAIHNAYPSVDYDDLMAGVDAVQARGFVDASRLYVTGVSGGGVLSSWIVGHTNRFAAAAVRAPVIDWISFAGNTDITSWGYARFEKPFWEDAATWLRHSPLMYVQNVRTPVLLMCGEKDLRTPMGQTEEYYQALQMLGVPVKMLRFNEEYHGTGSKPSNWMRTQEYILSWFGTYPGESSPPAQTTRR